MAKRGTDDSDLHAEVMDLIVYQLAAEFLALLPEQHAASALDRFKVVPRANYGRRLPAVMPAEDREARMAEFDRVAAIPLIHIETAARLLRQAQAEWAKQAPT